MLGAAAARLLATSKLLNLIILPTTLPFNRSCSAPDAPDKLTAHSIHVNLQTVGRAGLSKRFPTSPAFILPHMLRGCAGFASTHQLSGRHPQEAHDSAGMWAAGRCGSVGIGKKTISQWACPGIGNCNNGELLHNWALATHKRSFRKVRASVKLLHAHSVRWQSGPCSASRKGFTAVALPIQRSQRPIQLLNIAVMRSLACV